MSFLNSTPSASMIMGVGNLDARIMIVGDCPDVASMKARRPFAGPRETVLESCLHQAGLIKSEVYMTNLIKDDTAVSKYWKGQTNRKKIIRDIDGYRDVLMGEIASVKPNVIVTLDELPTYILTGEQSVVKVRGYPFSCTMPDGDSIIVLPSLHPAKMIWANYIWRHYLSHDLRKARKFANDTTLIGSPEIEAIIPSTFIEAKEYLDYICNFPKLSVDIEVANFEVSCVGFATSPTKAFSIPFDMRWELEEEVVLWNKVANILQDKNVAKIGQNFIFDIHFLAYKMGIFTEGEIIDTMMAHSIMYPDFLKGLNFLGSIHTNQKYWKAMVKHKNIKKES